MVWFTVHTLGGSSFELSSGIALDGSGSAYVTGWTASTDFPTEGEYQTDQGLDDVFVTKLNPSGNALVYSTYIGGDLRDRGVDIAVDGSGNAHIIGQTFSTNFPTKGAYQSTYQGGFSDVFFTKLNSYGNAFVYSTYLGGGSLDRGVDVALNGSGNAYITGNTQSTDFPIEGAYQLTNQGAFDAFVTKFTQPPNCCDLPGDFDGNGIVNIADLIVANRWIFGRGTAPDCLNDADVDASCTVDLTDVTFRINYMFSGGPDLLCGCVE